MELNCLVIIRSANERTVSICKKLIIEQGIPENQILIIEEAPFSKALLKSFEEGIKANAKWTFCVDADVLLRPNSIRRMIGFAEEMSQDVCEIQGYIMDKFFGGPRPGGIHLYRTALLPLVLQQIPKEGVDIRPESRTLNAMAKLGYPFKSVDYLVGIHDDYQYNFDIFRKCFVQAFKHGDRYNLFMSIWKPKAKLDQDFEVALKGFAAGVLHQEEVFINRELSVYREQYNLAGIIEKEELNSENISLATVEEQIQSWELSPVYLSYFPDLKSIAPPIPERKLTGKDKLKLKKRNLSSSRYFFYLLGYLVKKAGERLMLWTDKNKADQ